MRPRFNNTSHRLFASIATAPPSCLFRTKRSDMRKRPASSQVTLARIAKKPACNAQCWSCVAGGFGRYSSAARSNLEKHGCCARCCSSRTCTCRRFLEDKEAGWCRECNQFLARWCKKCNSEDELQSGLCSRCAGLVVPGSDRPKIRKDGVCWSCVAGAFGKASSDAQNAKGFFGCCVLQISPDMLFL